MGMDWKISRRWNREDEGPRPLCGSDGGRSVGETQEELRPLNERAGQRHALPTNFRGYVSNVYLPQRRKKWKDSTDQTTTERIGTHLITVFESFELSDLTRDRLQKFLDDKARSLSRSVVSHLRWDLNAIFKMAAEDTIIQGNPPDWLVTPKRSENSSQTHDDQRTGPVGVVCAGFAGKDHFPARRFGW